MATLQQRRNMLFTVFMETMTLDEESGVLASPVLRLLVKRLETLFTQFERFEVVAPLDSSSSYSSSSDSMRNPVHLLAKQIKIRLTGQGDGIPTDCQHLIVSTHAVATFRVLEEYLLSRIDDTDTLMKLLNPGFNGDGNDDLNGVSSSEEMDQDNGPTGKSKVSDPTTCRAKKKKKILCIKILNPSVVFFRTSRLDPKGKKKLGKRYRNGNHLLAEYPNATKQQHQQCRPPPLLLLLHPLRRHLHLNHLHQKLHRQKPPRLLKRTERIKNGSTRYSFT
jgi:hypothetical protein